MDGWAYWTLWFVVIMVVPKEKQQKGYIWRAVRATMFRWFFRLKPPHQCIRRFIFFSIPLSYGTAFFLDGVMATAAFYSVLIVMELDDYLNGDDDDRKKRWEAVKNKIKWLMDLPPKPAEGQVQS